MKITSTRIKANDFKQEDREMAEALGGIMNPFIDQLLLAFNKNLSVDDNLPFEFKTVNITVDGSGNPIGNNQLSTNLRNFKGYICINAIDASGSNSYPTSQPFISFTVSNNSIVIRNITGLQANIPYNLILLGIS